MSGTTETEDAEPLDGGFLPAGRYLAVFEPGSSRVVRLPATAELTVGRGTEAALRVDDKKVSRSHARIVVAPESVRVADLGSHNGTLVNGERVQGERVLRDGDLVEVGGTALVLHASDGRGSPVAAQVEARAARTVRIGGRDVVVADPAMLQLHALVDRLAASELPVLVHGETGAGKELVALRLHEASRRRTGRFVALNCAALAEGLVESELFGHVRGAFTGAVATKQGLLEAASGGTVLLDEIADLPPPAQAKLLRALDTGRIVRVGDTEERVVDVRVVAATHKDLGGEVNAGRFRSDLYFRLGGATVWVPPLRDRPRELELLARRFLDDACRKLARPPLRISPDAMTALAAYRWPGNVRELHHAMQSAAALVSGTTLDAAHVGERVAGSPMASPRAGSLDDDVRALEIARFRQALDASDGNQRRAAALLGVPLRTFATKLARYGLQRKQRS